MDERINFTGEELRKIEAVKDAMTRANMNQREKAKQGLADWIGEEMNKRVLTSLSAPVADKVWGERLKAFQENSLFPRLAEGDNAPKPVAPLHCPRGQKAYCWELLKALAGACPQCARCVEEAKARGVLNG